MSGGVAMTRATATAGQGIGMSPSLATNELVRARIAAGRPVLNLAFGDAGLPIHPALARALAAAADLNAYGSVAGEPGLRRSVARYWARRGFDTDPGRIVVGPGTKPLLFALLLALPGDVVLPQPSWSSYEPQARLARKQVVRVPAPPEAGGVPDPALLPDALDEARRGGADPRILVLTVPDNPTGTVAPAEVVAEVARIAVEYELVLLSDEMYRDLVHEPAAFSSPLEHAPVETIVTGGPSKSLALGGWRLGTVRLPESQLGREVRRGLSAVASELWSCVPSPIVRAAVLAYDEPSELVEFVRDGLRLHAQVVRALHREVVEAGLECRPPGAAFYLYPELRAPSADVRTSEELAARLLEEADVAVLPGTAFGDDPETLAFRASTSLLYGATADERREAMEAAREGAAAELPRVADALGRVRAALEALRGWA